MGHYKNKEEMFNARADRFEEEAKRYAKKGDTEKANWAKKQAKENRKKAKKYKGDDGW